MFPPETTSWKCPACGGDIMLTDLQEMQAFYCISCGVRLHMVLKGRWAYMFIAAVVGFLIAYLQGSESIVFAFKFLVYWAVAILAVAYLTWPLMLPKKFKVAEPFIQTLGIKPPKKN